MSNRGEFDREAIAASMEAGADKSGKNEGKAVFSSRYVHESEGVPNDHDVIAAIDAWADVWGNEVVSLVNHEGLLDMEDPEHKAASEHLADKAEAVAKLLPNAHFMTGLVLFDGGHVQLSGS